MAAQLLAKRASRLAECPEPRERLAQLRPILHLIFCRSEHEEKEPGPPLPKCKLHDVLQAVDFHSCRLPENVFRLRCRRGGRSASGAPLTGGALGAQSLGGRWALQA